jgi:ankyrin repeat protein
VATGDTEAVQQHLAAGADINGTYVEQPGPGYGGTPLHLATVTGQKEVIELLVEEGADINAKAGDESGGTPLHWVAGMGRTDFAGVLLEAGAEVNARDNYQGTPLHAAAAFGQTEAARMLIEKGADVDVKNNDGSTALYVAAFLCHTETVKLLLENGADVNTRNVRGETPLDTVAGEWSPELEGVYGFVEGILRIQLDLVKIKEDRPKIAAILRESGGKIGSELKAERDNIPGIDLWTPAGDGDIQAIERHTSAGADLDAKEPTGGSTPLIVAAAYGQAEAARLLIEKGADVNAKNNDGSTALHTAAFFCHTEIVKLLLEKGADVNAQNLRSETPLDAVAGEWNPELEGFYRFLAGILQTQLDLEKMKTLRPQIADLLRKSGGKAGGRRPENSGKTGRGSNAEAATLTALKGAYARDGRIHVGMFGAPDGKPLTTGPADMKPSWSNTSGKLVFFRVTKFAPEVIDWTTAICVVNVDGTGFRKLTDGTYTDFNPTWTRDGTEKAVFSRRKPGPPSFTIHMAAAGANPGDEYAVSDAGLSTYAYTCLKDGRIFVSCWDYPSGPGYFLMTPSPDGQPKYERVNFDPPLEGPVDRVSLAPSEKTLCYELQKGFGPYRYPGRTLYIADFDVAGRTVSNPTAITDTDPDPEIIRLYPRWTKDESAVVYHCNKTGKNQLYMYRLKDGSTIRVSTDENAAYLFPCGEETPK